ncbi:SelB domain-containing protein [Nonomuraea cavernae]|uniref:Selenocysteine-specific translation elongation factor n=1 Tax=Nonomuraea cavernae TaxID=2045107 RepID=A0A917YNT1_9ACTN|nr:SelB C-terminal domain-containing protein [Nonomuraea cavernae]MCA2183981.1 SelB C-terminal domain-containing protein [Nonomuraea cavernae]GGO61970.1 selenocysteine-specific translation elongation factor [Nonomuraea cavernae]
MHVVATAGHVDHGKSTLVRALTGMEPDRLEEERRRGLTIELGYAWATLPSGRVLAFVDVPGHERFLGTMLAGVGPVPAVMFVVAADEGWMPQSEEHLVALEALGVRRGLLVVTRCDLRDPAAAMEQARARLAAAGLAGVEALAVSGRTGQGVAELSDALDRLVAALPRPDPAAPVRLWVDRAFTVPGSGTVVTGTLPEGTISVGDRLELDGETVGVRSLESLKESLTSVGGVTRVAVNLRGRGLPERGQALVTPGRWTYTDLVDVRIHPAGGAAGDLPVKLTAHLGSAAVVCESRPLGPRVVRLRLARPLPLHLGDVLLLRDPGRDRGEVRVLAGASVLDVRPPALRRRGAARARAALLESAAQDAASALRSHRLLRTSDLLAMGAIPGGGSGPVSGGGSGAVQGGGSGAVQGDGVGAVAGSAPVCGDWHADPDYWAELADRLAEVVGRHAAEHPLEPGMPVEAARHALGLPDRRLVVALVRAPFAVVEGRILSRPPGLPTPVARAVERLGLELAASPFQAPEAGRLAELGLGIRELAAAVRAGRLLRVGEGVVLLPGADAQAAELLRHLPQPFTVSQARQALGTSRRVAVPLLEHLDRTGLTERVDDVHRRCRMPSSGL